MDREAVDSNIERNIPLEVVTDILSRLPFESLQRFKCVCKAWFHLLTKDSYFAKLHCERVMVGMARKYDHDLDRDMEMDIYFGRRRYLFWHSGGLNKKDEKHFPTDDQPFFDEVYRCFYGNCMTYSFRNFVRILNASGFAQRPCYWPLEQHVSFCNGSYVIEHARYVDGYLEYWSDPFGFFTFRGIFIAPTRKACQRITRSMFGMPRLCVDENTVRNVDENASHVVDFLRRRDVVIGTPRCVLDMLERRSLQFVVKKFVIYEADRLFSRGHKHEIYSIFNLLPKKVNVRVISGTITPEAIEIPRMFWDKRKEEWRRDTPLSGSIVNLQKNQGVVEKPPSNALDELKKSLRVERVKRVKCDKELASMIAFGKVKNKERRKKRSTISWNPHLKRHF